MKLVLSVFNDSLLAQNQSESELSSLLFVEAAE